MHAPYGALIYEEIQTSLKNTKQLVHNGDAMILLWAVILYLLLSAVLIILNLSSFVLTISNYMMLFNLIQVKISQILQETWYIY